MSDLIRSTNVVMSYLACEWMSLATHKYAEQTFQKHPNHVAQMKVSDSALGLCTVTLQQFDSRC